MRFIFVMILQGIMLFPIFAQILKVDKSHLATDSSNYLTGIVDGSIAINNRSSTADQQNVYVGLRNNLDLVYVAEKSATVLIGGFNYFKIGSGPVISNGTGHIREIFRRNAKLTPEAFGQLQYDQSRRMEARELIGGGLRWQALQGKNSLNIGLGTFHEHERWNAGGDVILKDLWKMNSYLSGEINLSDRMQINAIAYFQTGRDASINSYRSRVSGHIEFKDKISERFKVKLSGDFLLDDRPIIPLNRLIYETYFGIEYSFN
jgi:hypothetical protein